MPACSCNRDPGITNGYPERSTPKSRETASHLYKSTKNLSTQLLQEVDSQAIQSQQQINIVKAQINAKQRDARLNQLTGTELSQLSRDTKVYEGSGKMSVTTTLWCHQSMGHD